MNGVGRWEVIILTFGAPSTAEGRSKRGAANANSAPIFILSATATVVEQQELTIWNIAINDVRPRKQRSGDIRDECCWVVRSIQGTFERAGTLQADEPAAISRGVNQKDMYFRVHVSSSPMVAFER